MTQNPGPSRIVKLSDPVIRKIAAGEVVDRPANVVKELLENSLDSGASEIVIEIGDGGAGLISVSDNGCGISPEDLPQAVACHSTSKLTDFTDLSTLTTMGFRGEALSSISAVSRFSIKSKTQLEDGLELRIDNDQQMAAPYTLTYTGKPGTVVACEDLFFNVPARKRFLRRKETEFSHILEVVHAIALGHPWVSIRLSHDGKEVFRHDPPEAFSKTDQELEVLRELAASLLGVTEPSRLTIIQQQNIYGSLKALITPPGIDYSFQKRMFTYVNRRWVRDKVLNALITRGYHTHILKGRYPGCVLFFDCEPSLIDVNIHPSKKEIKFQYQKEVARLIHEAIQSSLRSAAWANPPEIKSSDRGQVMPTESHLTPTTPTPPTAVSSGLHRHLPLRQISPPPSSLSMPSSPPSVSEQASANPFPGAVSRQVEIRRSEPQQPPHPREDEDKENNGRKDPLAQRLELTADLFNQDVIPWSELVYLGMFASLYWVMEDPKNHKLILVDQHAFHERILFEKLKSQCSEMLKPQKLLIPSVVDLSPSEVGYLVQEKDQLKELGITFEHTPSSISLLTIPALLVKSSHKDLLEKLAHQSMLASSADATRAWITEDVLATFACHSAIRGGDIMTEAARGELLREAESVNFYHNCPHGRRVFHILTAREVSRWFDR